MLQKVKDIAATMVSCLIIFGWIPVVAIYQHYHIVCDTESISYKTTFTNGNDSNIDLDSTPTTLTKGVDGKKRVCTKDGKAVSTKVLTKPVNEVDEYGYLPDYPDPPDPRGDDTAEYMTPAPASSSNVCPVTTCADGTCSMSTGRGTCSWHGGEAY